MSDFNDHRESVELTFFHRAVKGKSINSCQFGKRRLHQVCTSRGGLARRGSCWACAGRAMRNQRLRYRVVMCITLRIDARHPRPSSVKALVYRGSPAWTHKWDPVSRMRHDQTANSCGLASSCVVLRGCLVDLWSDVIIVCISTHLANFTIVTFR